MNIDINLWHKNSSDTEKENLANISRKAETIENADEIVLQYLTQEADYELDRKCKISCVNSSSRYRKRNRFPL